MLSLMLMGMVIGCDGNSNEEKETEYVVKTDPALNGRWAVSDRSGGSWLTDVFTFDNGKWELTRIREQIDVKNWISEYDSKLIKLSKGTFTTEDNIITFKMTHVFRDGAYRDGDYIADFVVNTISYSIEGNVLTATDNAKQGSLTMSPKEYTKIP